MEDHIEVKKATDEIEAILARLKTIATDLAGGINVDVVVAVHKVHKQGEKCSGGFVLTEVEPEEAAKVLWAGLAMVQSIIAVQRPPTGMVN